MAPIDPLNRHQLPAVDSKLATYIDTALACLQVWARANGQNWESLTDPHALLLKTLLAKSKPEVTRGVAPIIPLSELQNLMTDGLTGRKWEQFLRWYGREIERPLEKTCAQRAQKLLYPGRSTSGSGGRGPKGQAIYFLSFDRPAQLEKPGTGKPAVADSTERNNGSPGPKTPPGDAESGGSSQTARESPAAGYADDAAANPDGRSTASIASAPSKPCGLSLPLGLLLNLPSTDRGDSFVGWFVAIALAFALVTSTVLASDPLTDEIVRAFSTLREILSGDVIVRL